LKKELKIYWPTPIPYLRRVSRVYSLQFSVRNEHLSEIAKAEIFVHNLEFEYARIVYRDPCALLMTRIGSKCCCKAQVAIISPTIN
jgi:hypothetical protein